MITIYDRSLRTVYNLENTYPIPKIESGMIATISGNNRVKICTDKDLPVGIFISEFYDEPTMAGYVKRIVIASGTNRYKTNMFEKSKYKVNDLLYCSPNGKITNEKKYKGKRLGNKWTIKE